MSRRRLYKNDNLIYEASYDYSSEHTYRFSGAADKSWLEENFNAALSDLIGRLLTDLELLKAMRRG